MKIILDELKKITVDAYRKARYPEEQIAIIFEVLYFAQLRGNLQSLLQIKMGIPPYHATAPIEKIKETRLSCLLNGHDNIGICVMHQSMQIVLEKAKVNGGFAIVGSSNSAPPGTAALSYYVKQLAEAGLIAFAFSGSSKKVAPFGGYQALFGTNPIAVGLPCHDTPIVIDMATSSIPLFKVLSLQLQQHLLPENVAYDHQGNKTCDPNAVLKENGTLTTFGNDAKSYSLSLLVEALTGPLVGAAFATLGDTQHNWGNVIYAFDPELLVGLNAFKDDMAKLRAAVKSSQCLPDVKVIFLPGELSEQKAKQAIKQGWIEIDAALAPHLLIQ